MVPGTDARIKPGQKLTREYYDSDLPNVRRRLCQSELRLALVLNDAFSADPREASTGRLSDELTSKAVEGLVTRYGGLK